LVGLFFFAIVTFDQRLDPLERSCDVTHLEE
jgi:hypothetical protein